MTALAKIKEKLSLLTRDPIVDIEETKSHSLLSFDLPNVKPDDLEISISGKTLIIAVKRQHQCATNSETTKVIQCHHHNFSREFSFPIILSPETIDAYYQNGILRIAVPKNTLFLKQTVPIATSPCGVFLPTKPSAKMESIESYSDIDDYDWE